jgi:hypothetical protein
MGIGNFLARSTRLRRLLAPALTVRARLAQSKFNRSAQLVDRFTDALVEDPIVRVPEFEGTFEIDRRSDVLRRLLIDGRYEPELSRQALRTLVLMWGSSPF